MTEQTAKETVEEQLEHIQKNAFVDAMAIVRYLLVNEFFRSKVVNHLECDKELDDILAAVKAFENVGSKKSKQKFTDMLDEVLAAFKKETK